MEVEAEHQAELERIETEKEREKERFEQAVIDYLGSTESEAYLILGLSPPVKKSKNNKINSLHVGPPMDL